MRVGRLCKLFGKSRQAYYQREAFNNEQYQVGQIALELVTQVRRESARTGHKEALLALKRTVQNPRH